MRIRGHFASSAGIGVSVGSATEETPMTEHMNQILVFWHQAFLQTKKVFIAYAAFNDANYAEEYDFELCFISKGDRVFVPENAFEEQDNAFEEQDGWIWLQSVETAQKGYAPRSFLRPIIDSWRQRTLGSKIKW